MREKQYVKSIAVVADLMREKLWLLLLGLAIVYGFLMYGYHTRLHGHNDCEMTFMWRPIFLPRIDVASNVSTYGLYQYHEGIWTDFAMNVFSNDIPVLFVPGSGGSAKQVRSVASVMMNKTMMRSAPFRMSFYAVDFDEELSFMSASTLLRQREFVLRSIETLLKMYKKSNYRKIILIGHSFGGVVIKSLPLHPSFDVSVMDLIITQASPLNRPPILLDKEMESLYNDIEQIWKLRQSSLSHIGFLSYSGGVKDFQVTDSMAKSEMVRHLPSWSVRGCDTAADHLCILWCNGLVRHSTRLLYDYAMESRLKKNPMNGKVIVDAFYEKHLHTDASMAEEIQDIRLFENPVVEWTYTSSINQLTGFSSWRFPYQQSFAFYVIIKKLDESTCKGELNGQLILADGLSMMSDRNSTINIGQRSNAGEGLLKLSGPPGCEYSLVAKVDLIATIYQITIDNVQALVHLVVSLVVILFIIEDVLGVNVSPLSVSWVPVVLGCVSFLTLDSTVSVILATNVVILILVLLMVAKLLSSLISLTKVYYVFNNNLVILLLVLFFSQLNAHLGCAFLVLSLGMRRVNSSSPSSFLTSVLTSVIHLFLAINGPGCSAIKQQFLDLIDLNYESLLNSFEYSITSVVTLLAVLSLQMGGLDGNNISHVSKLISWMWFMVSLLCLAYLFSVVLQLQMSLESTILPAPLLILLNYWKPSPLSN